MRQVVIRAPEPQSMWTPKRVKQLRQRYDETQEEFAKRFRASVETVKTWEQGKRPVSAMASVILDDLEARGPQLTKVG